MAVKTPLTNTGLSALASAVNGAYQAPLYLVIDTAHSVVVTTITPGATSVTLDTRRDQPGDTQLVLSAGLPAQEVVTFSGAPTNTGGNWVYTLSAATANTHNANDPVVRVPLQSDTLASVTSEAQYDPVGNPNGRLVSLGGYSPGNGQWTMQFFLPGTQGTVFIATVGLSDSATVGQGNLHAYAVVGIDHTIPNGQTYTFDLELDLGLNLVNN